MQIISISRGIYSRGEEIAQLLAKKLDYACLGRDELVEAATKEGIQVGKLEMAMIKPGLFNEKLALEKDHYLAFSTTYICDKATKKGLVYHGRSGHLLLPGISHVLRVRVFADEEHRINTAMGKLGVDRKKAQRYIADVDEDCERWIHSMYGVSWEDSGLYDVSLNLDQISLGNAASVLANIAQMPDFQMTPASKNTIQDLYLAAATRSVLAQDSRTHNAVVKVRADGGKVTVTYLPQDAQLADAISKVCGEISAITELNLTMAMTNLLWIQEDFQPDTQIFDQVVQIATKWNAAVELLKFQSDSNGEAEEASVISAVKSDAAPSGEYNGGIEDDGAEHAVDSPLKTTLDKLAILGKSGGGHIVRGGQRQLLGAIDRTIPYTLVVIGDVFQSKGHAAKLRAVRDLRSFLGDRIKAPVVTSDELESQFLFGKRDIFRFALSAGIAAVIFLLVFYNQKPVLEFLANTGWYAQAVGHTALGKFNWLPKAIVSIVVFLFVPVFAASYGNVAHALLKLIKME